MNLRIIDDDESFNRKFLHTHQNSMTKEENLIVNIRVADSSRFQMLESNLEVKSRIDSSNPTRIAKTLRMKASYAKAFDTAFDAKGAPGI